MVMLPRANLFLVVIDRSRRRTTGSVAEAMRHYSRGIPYTPVGTIQDFTSSPRHMGIGKLLREKDEAMNRSGDGDYAGPIITTPQGSRPMFGPRGGSYDMGPSSHFSRPPPSSFDPHSLPLYGQTSAMSSETYRQDCRFDPRYDHLPDHVRAAQQSVVDMQHDSYGESIRGMVPPPPPVSEMDAPTPYRPPRPAIPPYWYTIVVTFLAVFVLMGRYGL